jgi:hypothetical protein
MKRTRNAKLKESNYTIMSFDRKKKKNVKHIVSSNLITFYFNFLLNIGRLSFFQISTKTKFLTYSVNT